MTSKPSRVEEKALHDGKRKLKEAKKAASTGLFKWSADWRKAARRYEEAADFFRAANDHGLELRVDAYRQAARAYDKLEDTSSAVKILKLAVQVLTGVSGDETDRTIKSQSTESAGLMFGSLKKSESTESKSSKPKKKKVKKLDRNSQECLRLLSAADLYQELAMYHLLSSHEDHAADAYLQAAQLFFRCSDVCLAVKSMLKCVAVYIPETVAAPRSGKKLSSIKEIKNMVVSGARTYRVDEIFGKVMALYLEQLMGQGGGGAKSGDRLDEKSPGQAQVTLNGFCDMCGRISMYYMARAHRYGPLLHQTIGAYVITLVYFKQYLEAYEVFDWFQKQPPEDTGRFGRTTLWEGLNSVLQALVRQSEEDFIEALQDRRKLQALPHDYLKLTETIAKTGVDRKALAESNLAEKDVFAELRASGAGLTVGGSGAGTDEAATEFEDFEGLGAGSSGSGQSAPDSGDGKSSGTSSSAPVKGKEDTVGDKPAVVVTDEKQPVPAQSTAPQLSDRSAYNPFGAPSEPEVTLDTIEAQIASITAQCESEINVLQGQTPGVDQVGSGTQSTAQSVDIEKDKQGGDGQDSSENAGDAPGGDSTEPAGEGNADDGFGESFV